MDTQLLDILCCPATHQPFRLAEKETLTRATAKAGTSVEEGLLREDGQVLYPISNGIPLLLVESGITL